MDSKLGEIREILCESILSCDIDVLKIQARPPSRAWGGGEACRTTTARRRRSRGSPDAQHHSAQHAPRPGQDGRPFAHGRSQPSLSYVVQPRFCPTAAAATAAAASRGASPPRQRSFLSGAWRSAGVASSGAASHASQLCARRSSSISRFLPSINDTTLTTACANEPS